MNQPAQKIINNFKKYLKNKNLSEITIKNYASDLRQFLNWSAKNNKSFVDQVTFSSYKKHLIKQKNPTKSINRYLSTLRKFATYLTETSDLKKNPAEKLQNIDSMPVSNQEEPQILQDFQKSLKKKGLSKTTIKNYMSDIKQFWHFLKTETDRGQDDYWDSKSLE